jgi:signal transduction histidine kinase
MTQAARLPTRILVIDDDRDIWKAYRLILSPDRPDPESSSARISQLLNEGVDEQATDDTPCFDLSFASQGEEGYQIVKEAMMKLEPFAMAFIDVRMPPGWDGMETAIKIRQFDPQIELVIVTAYSDRSMEEIVQAVGASDKLLFLRKPFDPEELKQIARCMTSKWQIANLMEQQRQGRQLLEEQLRQAQKMESIGTLAGGIAHDFNNILSAIMGYTDLALMRINDQVKVSQDLGQIRKASSRAADLVRQILTFSRRGHREMHPVQISLVIKEALKLLRASIPTTIDIRTEINSEATVLADPTQIHQLIMNLCTNAFQAMMDRGGILGVSLTESEIGQNTIDSDNLAPGRYVNISVSDTGIGMDQETKARIFEPYFTTKETGKGTGLGLAVVHGIVEGYHGRIAINSQPGCGTTFTVSLPVTTMQALPLPPSSLPLLSKSHEHVMVVDDEEPIRDLIRQLLTEAGYRADVFANGMDAWQAVSNTPKAWDLLITDQTMPGITGDQLASLVMAIRPEMPVILSSGYVPTMNADQAKKVGVSAYLQKPLDRESLLNAVAMALRVAP